MFIANYYVIKDCNFRVLKLVPYHAIYHQKERKKLYIILHFESNRRFSLHVKAMEI